MKLKTTIFFFLVVLMATALKLNAQSKTVDPWKSEQLMDPEILATMISNFPADRLPVILNVGPAENIKGAISIGPAGKEEGLKALQEKLKTIPKNKQVVIYCGCCPLYKCPNIRPAYQALASQGFTNIRVLSLASNLKTDWIAKGYPVTADGK